MVYQPAFPVELQAIASELLPALAVGEQWPAQQGFVVQIHSQPLSAPSRVYYSPSCLRSVISNSVSENKIFALCLGSCHWNGFVREECVRELLKFDRPWVAPFIIQLLGEYVVEIVRVIAARLPYVNTAIYREFVRENPAFLATTKRRAISYWDCYYRNQYSRLQDYPGVIAIKQIEGMA